MLVTRVTNSCHARPPLGPEIVCGRSSSPPPSHSSRGPAAPTTSGSTAPATGGCSGTGTKAISALLDGGYTSLTPDGEKPLPRTQVPDAVKAWASRQFAKWVDARSPAARSPVGDELEIVPVTDLAAARAGDKIAIRVLLGGKPAPGALVAVGHRVIGETDREGVTRLRLRDPGAQSISTSVRRPLSTPEADSLVLEASLGFEVGK